MTSTPINQTRMFLTTVFDQAMEDQLGEISIWSGSDKLSTFHTDVASAAESAIERSGTQNVYVGCGLRRAGLGPDQRGCAEDVTCIVGVWSDVDIECDHHRGDGYPPDLASAEELVASIGLTPSMVINSGGGLQAWWLFSEPWMITNDEERDEASQFCRRWHLTVDSHAKQKGYRLDNVSDLARVMRVPGTFNHKSTPAKPVALIKSETISKWDRDHIENIMIAKECCRERSDDKVAVNAQYSLNATAPHAVDLATRSPSFHRIWERRRDDLRDQSPSAYEMALACEGVKQGWTDQQIADAFLAWRSKHGEDTEKLKRSDYLSMTIGKARESLQTSQGVSARGSSGRPWPNPIDEAAFHGLAGDIVRAIEPHTEADPVALLLDLLVSVGNACGRNPYFLADGARHYPNLFVVLVGNTSKGRKGTARAQIKRVMEMADPQWTSYSIQSGLSSGEGLIYAVRDPSYKRQKGEDGNYEDVESDPGVDDKRLLVTESEYASVLKVMGREGNTISPIIRLAWDGANLQTLTKNSPTKATGAHVSIIAHISRDELHRRLDSTEAASGFGNRYLWVCVERSKVLPDGGCIDQVDFGPIATQLKAVLLFAAKEQRFVLDAQARKIWHRVYPDLSEGKPGMFGSLTARAEAQVMRLALVYAVLDQSPLIKSAHLLAALAVWEYCEASVRYLYGDALGDPVADELLRALRQADNNGLTRTEISALFQRHKGASQIGRVLGLLLDHGYARCTTEQTEGRSTERWYIATATPKTKGGAQ